MPEEKKRPIAVMSIDTRTIYDRLLKTVVGDVVHYDEMEKLVGRSVRDKGAWILASARRKALNENGMLFGAVAKVGVKRLSDTEILDVGYDVVKRVHRASLYGVRKIAAVSDYAALPAAEKVRHGVYASALGMLAHVTREKQLKMLEGKVQQSQTTLPLQKTLEAFRA